MLIVGGTRAERLRRADAVEAAAPLVLRLDDVERAFPNKQIAGTRFVLTQSTYVMQVLLDSLTAGTLIVATADGAALARNAPEAFDGRGPWRFFEVVDESHSTTVDTEEFTEDTAHSCTAFGFGSDIETAAFVLSLLNSAFDTTSADERFASCGNAVAIAPESALAWLARASAAREVQNMSAAREALDRALRLAPAWAAAHFEDGKFWLGYDDMMRARDSFRHAADLMPTFSAAFSNLGATLGELDEPDAALLAFEKALAHDPRGFHIINNIGVTTRELGRLDESEAAFRRVIDLAPDFVFGYYNLGHTLFLAGKYADARWAYEEGQARDPEKNRRQACRLAMMRLATGDIDGASRELWRVADEAPPADREELLLEAYEIAHALLSAHPELSAARPLLERIAEALKV